MPNIVLWDDAGRMAARPSWNPFSLFEQLDAMLDTVAPAATEAWPTFDVIDREDEVVLIADLPGVRQEDVEVTATGPILTITGSRAALATEGDRYMVRGRRAGSFTRHFRLNGIDADNIVANLRDGVLEVHMPKPASARPRRIALNAGLVDKVKGLLKKDTPEADK